LAFCADRKAVTATDDVSRTASTPLDPAGSRTGQDYPPNPFGRALLAFCWRSPLARQFHRSLAIARRRLHIIVDRTPDNRLERLEGDQFWSFLPSVDKASIVKKPSELRTLQTLPVPDTSGPNRTQMCMPGHLPLREDGRNARPFSFFKVVKEFIQVGGGDINAACESALLIPPATMPISHGTP